MIIFLNTFIIIATALTFYFFNSRYFIIALIEVLLTILQLLSHAATALINPGMPTAKPITRERLETIKNNRRLYCAICKIEIVPEKKIVHCEDCDVCVEGFDHHCPWTGKCIGRRNIIPFYIFLIVTGILIYYIIFASIFCLYCYS